MGGSEDYEDEYQYNDDYDEAVCSYDPTGLGIFLTVWNGTQSLEEKLNKIRSCVPDSVHREMNAVRALLVQTVLKRPLIPPGVPPTSPNTRALSLSLPPSLPPSLSLMRGPEVGCGGQSAGGQGERAGRRRVRAHSRCVESWGTARSRQSKVHFVGIRHILDGLRRGMCGKRHVLLA
eukprot:675854-Rhodomonas_salina.1